jgi:glutamate dehydrogenase (NADP+)
MPYIESVLNAVVDKNPNEPEFHQAVREVLESLQPVFQRFPRYEEQRILERITEPERSILFRVPWVDDAGTIRVNKGFRVEFNSAIGPYKGGLRFHPSVNLGILKFLGFEQIFKNALTTLPMGGGKGGSDFDPKGKSDNEVMRFCQSFMNELFRHIGHVTDVPAGDVGVGSREIGYLFGQYKRLRNEFTGVLTGKAVGWGGSLVRPEATGYGSVYFAEEMLAVRNQSIEGKICLVSGAGNVAQYTVQKLLQLGAKPVSLSDSNGTIYDPDGFSAEKFQFVQELKNVRRGRLAEYQTKYPTSKYLADQPPWSIPCECAFPSATQNEINGEAAAELVKNGCKLVCEGANMPCDFDAVSIFQRNKLLYGPGKAANAGGVATSGLEMAQNAQFMSWSRDEVDAKLKSIIKNIHQSAYSTAAAFDSPGNYLVGANIAGFLKVANAMIDQGVV